MSLAALAADEGRQVDGALLDYLIIESVNSLKQSTTIASKRQRELEEEMSRTNLLQQLSTKESQPPNAEELLKFRLEKMGSSVGANIAERLSRDRPRFVDTLDTVKFICKDVWIAVWDKQVDNLRTNHRGVYVLQDNAFKPLLRISSPDGNPDAIAKAKIYVAFHAGLLKGALARLGLQGTVTPEISSLPQCVFQIKLPKT